MTMRSCRVLGAGFMSSTDVDDDGPHDALGRSAGERPLPNGRIDVAEAAVRVRLGDVIPTDTTCVRSDVTIDEVTALMRETPLRALPVVDENRRLLGIVSRTDLFRKRDRAKSPRAPGGRQTVADVMTRVVHGLPEDAPIAYAISLMAFESLHEVPVVDADSHVIGMITATDTLRWVAQALGYVVPTAKAKP
jgi:CBS domain-containing protein